MTGNTIEIQCLSEQEKIEAKQSLNSLSRILTRALSCPENNNVSGNFHDHIDELLDEMTEVLKTLGVNI